MIRGQSGALPSLPRSTSEAYGEAGIEWQKEIKQSRLMSFKYYPRYLLELVKSTSVYGIYTRILAYFRRYRLFSTIFKILTKVIVWAETSAVFIVSFSATVIIVLPLTALLFVVSLLAALLGSRKANERLAAEIASRKRIYVFFGHKKQVKKGTENDFFAENVKNMASDGSLSLVISPHLVGTSGVGGAGAYFTARKESENVYMVRKNYYFVLYRTLLLKRENRDKIRLIY